MLGKNRLVPKETHTRDVLRQHYFPLQQKPVLIFVVKMFSNTVTTNKIALLQFVLFQECSNTPRREVNLFRQGKLRQLLTYALDSYLVPNKLLPLFCLIRITLEISLLQFPLKYTHM